MLVLARKPGEKITIGPDITITICGIARGAVRVGIDAPRDIDIDRPDAKKGPRPLRAVMDDGVSLSLGNME